MSALLLELKQLIVSELDVRDRTAESLGDTETLFGGPLGLDSLDALQLAVAVEERFGVRIPEGDEARRAFAHARALADYIEAHKNESG